MAETEEYRVPDIQTMAELIRVNGVPAEVRLTAVAVPVDGFGDGGWLQWREAGAGGRERCLAVERDVLGVARQGRSVTIKAFLATEKSGGGGGVLSCEGTGCGGAAGRRERVRRDFVLQAPTEESAVAWGEALQRRIDSLGRPKRLLVLLNPFGGKKCAQKIFRDEVKPLLDAAGIYYTVQETKYQLHAQEIAYDLDFAKYDGIVCVSGDGILVEVVNGLLQREDWQTAIKMPLGIIPAGSGNGMAKSLLDSADESCSASNAIFAVIRGHKCSLDVSSVKQGNTSFFSVLMLSWGLVADIDIESEKYRWMGSSRFVFYAFLRVINLRKYHGRLSFVPAPGYEDYGIPVEKMGECSGTTGVLVQGKEDGVASPRNGYQGPITSFKNSEWRTIDGPFVAVWLHNVPWASEDAMPAPEAKFSDGYVDMVMIKDCPKSALASFLLKLSDGSHVKSPHVMYIKVKAFRLEPGHQVKHPAKGGIIDSDGEAIARGRGTYQCHNQADRMAYGPPIQMTVEQGLATLFAPKSFILPRL